MSESERVAESLSWEQPRLLQEEFRLVRGKEAIASLDFRSSLGTLATGRVDLGEWTFKRLGFLRTRITVRAAGSDQAIATFQPSTWIGGGTLELPDGRTFKVDISFWYSRLDILAPDGRPLLRYRPKGVFHQGAAMDLFVGAEEVQEYPWLMLFGWYLAVLIHRDMSAVAV